MIIRKTKDRITFDHIYEIFSENKDIENIKEHDENKKNILNKHNHKIISTYMTSQMT
jgi:hypothetical protein